MYKHWCTLANKFVRIVMVTTTCLRCVSELTFFIVLGTRTRNGGKTFVRELPQSLLHSFLMWGEFYWCLNVLAILADTFVTPDKPNKCTMFIDQLLFRTLASNRPFFFTSIGSTTWWQPFSLQYNNKTAVSLPSSSEDIHCSVVETFRVRRKNTG